MRLTRRSKEGTSPKSNRGWKPSTPHGTRHQVPCTSRRPSSSREHSRRRRRASRPKVANPNPKVSGAGAGTQHLSQATAQLMDAAVKEAAALKDEYISTEHLLLAIIASGSSAGRLLSDQGATRENLYAALKEVRGAQRVTDQMPEEKYRSLERFGRDLNEL